MEWPAAVVLATPCFVQISCNRLPEASMVGNTRLRQGLKRRSRTRIRTSRLVRRARLRCTIHAVQKRAGPIRMACLPSRSLRRARGSASWIVPLMTVVQGSAAGSCGFARLSSPRRRRSWT